MVVDEAKSGRLSRGSDWWARRDLDKLLLGGETAGDRLCLDVAATTTGAPCQLRGSWASSSVLCSSICSTKYSASWLARVRTRAQ